MLLNYKTKNQILAIGGYTFQLEMIQNLDEAIDELCEKLPPQDQMRAFHEELCPYFGHLWPSAEALCEFLSLHPEKILGKNVLEIGSGLSLPSLWSLKAGAASVLATDFHPDVEFFLKKHLVMNQLEKSSWRFQKYSWKEEVLTEDFDIILGSDILYEGTHPEQIVQFLHHHLRPSAVAYIADPGRSYVQRFSSLLVEQGFSSQSVLQKTAKGEEVFIFSIQKK
jgi:predicted nicotinamide N-methyase